MTAHQAGPPALPTSATAAGSAPSSPYGAARPADATGGPSPAHVPYYLVPTPASPGDEDSMGLYNLAVAVLGDGDAYQRIVALNAKRPQPDGAKLTSPDSVDPGWYLVLPCDAHGRFHGVAVRWDPPADAVPPGSVTESCTSAAYTSSTAGSPASPSTASGRRRADLSGGGLVVFILVLALGTALVLAVLRWSTRRGPAGPPAREEPAAPRELTGPRPRPRAPVANPARLRSIAVSSAPPPEPAPGTSPDSHD